MHHRSPLRICLSGLTGSVLLALAPGAQAAPPPPCQEIRAACQSAGFILHEARAGDGLYADCVVPIMRGIAQPPKAVRPLPPVPPQVVAACRAADPVFGEKHRPQ